MTRELVFNNIARGTYELANEAAAVDPFSIVRGVANSEVDEGDEIGLSDLPNADCCYTMNVSRLCPACLAAYRRAHPRRHATHNVSIDPYCLNIGELNLTLNTQFPKHADNDGPLPGGGIMATIAADRAAEMKQDKRPTLPTATDGLTVNRQGDCLPDIRIDFGKR